ncbi:MAG: putative addiction module component [Myxococcales bacterium]|nr:putative addiction module component [Myxococcales bacterium]
MTAQARQIIDQALKLDEEERAEVAHEMLASLGSAEVSSNFARELERRIRDVDSGAVKPVSWSEVQAELEILARGR